MGIVCKGGDAHRQHWDVNGDCEECREKECRSMAINECVANGGHCFERTGFSHPMIPPEYQEICKHCKLERWATPREPFDYRYPS